jgi:PKD repeat protein
VFCAGDTVRFTNNSINANAWRWNFGDGNTSSLQNPTHTYATGGTYTITLQADKVITQGIVCTDSKQTTVTVTSKPPANISFNSAGLHCIPYTLTAAALGLGNETATWYIIDTTITPSLIIINGPNAQYTYLKPGTFSVKLVVVNSAGCTDSSVINFTVRNKAISAFSPLNVSTCKNDTTILHINNTTYTGIDPLQYRWYVDNSLMATSVNLTHQYLLGAASLPNTFNTWLITTNTFGCSDTAKGTVVMQQPPKGIFNFANPNTCVPFILQVNNTSSGATLYRWLLNGVQVSTAATPTFAITQPSTLYTLTLITSNVFGCKTDTVTHTFTTLSRPKAKFTVSDTLSCGGTLNIAVNNQTTGANNYTWIWSDGSPNSNFTNPTHLYTALGNFPIILMASDGTCRDTTIVNVKVANKPVVDFSVNKTSDCGTTVVSFTNLTTLASGYLWDFGDGTFSTLTNPVKTFAPRITAYTIKLVATGTFGCKDSLVKPNLVLAKILPAAGFVVSPGNIIAIPNFTFNFINSTPQSNNYKYTWSFGDNSIPAITRDASHRYQDTGKYLVKLGVFDNVSNCTDTVSQFVQITGFPGYLYVPNAFQPGSLQPILKTFLPIGTGLATYRLQIFTTWGQKIFESTSLDAKGAPNEGWNGQYNGKDNFNQGKPLQQDNYIWRIDAVFKNGTEWKGMSYPNQPAQKRVGTVTIIR